jgi:succinyl-CoA synthetase alpha subunit
MSILVDQNSRVLIQGITGRAGSRHSRLMRDAGTRVVAGVTPGKGGTTADGVPVFDTVAAAVAATGADVSVVFVPAPRAAEAVLEAFEAGLAVVACITDGIPILDMMRLRERTTGSATILVGPNCPGIASPGRCLAGIMPADIFRPGRVGVVSRSGTLTYEAVDALSREGFGQSTCVGIGGDPVHGLSLADCLLLFQRDQETDAVLLLGEIGGTDEEDAARLRATGAATKPTMALVAGRWAPPGRRMGHAGAIVSQGRGTAAEKIAALEGAGIPVCPTLRELPAMMREATR